MSTDAPDPTDAQGERAAQASPELSTIDIHLLPEDNVRLANLLGQFDEHMRLIEGALGVTIVNRGNRFQVRGGREVAQAAAELVQSLYEATSTEVLVPDSVRLRLQAGDERGAAPAPGERGVIRTRRRMIRGRGENQLRYIENIQNFDLCFGVGPAGTGKTYLAAACAVEALEAERVRRIVLVRPAVEAGEHLGFLPGDLAQKIDPYLRPLYDALYDMLGFERVGKLLERHVIEIAPLAYMRGRTLNDAFVILDEAQNTTIEQMKMFLTRIGFGTKAVVTGDVTQVDLPRAQVSGLRDAIRVLQETNGISMTHFQSKDVVRHPLVQRIVDAYERRDRESGVEPR